MEKIDQCLTNLEEQSDNIHSRALELLAEMMTSNTAGTPNGTAAAGDKSDQAASDQASNGSE